MLVDLPQSHRQGNGGEAGHYIQLAHRQLPAMPDDHFGTTAVAAERRKRQGWGCFFARDVAGKAIHLEPHRNETCDRTLSIQIGAKFDNLRSSPDTPDTIQSRSQARLPRVDWDKCTVRRDMPVSA
jgi:hypothetical protein